MFKVFPTFFDNSLRLQLVCRLHFSLEDDQIETFVYKTDAAEYMEVHIQYNLKISDVVPIKRGTNSK